MLGRSKPVPQDEIDDAAKCHGVPDARAAMGRSADQWGRRGKAWWARQPLGTEALYLAMQTEIAINGDTCCSSLK